MGTRALTADDEPGHVEVMDGNEAAVHMRYQGRVVALEQRQVGLERRDRGRVRRCGHGTEWGTRGTVRLLNKWQYVARLVLLDLLLEYALQGLANEPLSCGRQLFRYFAAVNLNRFKFRTTANTFRGIVYVIFQGSP